MKANDLKKGHNLLLFNINSCSAYHSDQPAIKQSNFLSKIEDLTFLSGRIV